MNTLGKVGIDIIRISGFTCLNHFEEPVIKHLITDTKIINFLQKGNAEIKNNSVRINEKFFLFKWGNRGGRSYAYLEIHASDAAGNNLQNMSMADVKARFYNAISILKKRYKITFPMLDFSSLRVTYLEINRTATTRHPFYAYSPFLRLMGYLMRKNLGMKSSGVFSTDQDNTMKAMDECIYLIRGKKNYEVKAYDKAKELKAKKVLSPDDVHNYMRLELTLKKESEIKSHGTHAYFLEITDDDIKQLYQRKIGRMVTAANTYFQHNLFEGRPGSPAVDQILMTNLLRYDIDNSCSYDLFLKDILLVERNNGNYPYIKGIEALYEVIKNIKYISDKQKCCDHLYSTCVSNPCYEELLVRSSLYGELESILLSEQS